MAGSITIKLYNVSDDNEKINKTLGTAKEFTSSTIKDQTDVTNITLRIQTTDNLSGYNYAYVSEYGRYYFIDKIETTPTGYWVLSCRCDVLMSFKDQLLQLDGTVTRSESLYNGYLNDSEYKALAYRKIVTKQFPTAVNQDTFILMTVGATPIPTP